MNEEKLFHQAREKPAGERGAFLAEACRGDDALRRHLEALLEAADNPGGFLARPVLGPAAGGPPELSGGRVGPYRLLQPIGEGGMGSVWLAEQTQPVQRKVALKVIKPG